MFQFLTHAFCYVIDYRSPYRIPLSAVTLSLLHTSVSPSHIFHVFNASLVALCVASSNDLKHATTGPCDIRILYSPPETCECIGYGIIRAIDVPTATMYVLTPIEPELLKRVNLLVKGALEVPSTFLWQVRRMKEGEMCLDAESVNMY